MRRRTFLLGGAALGVLTACGDTGRDEREAGPPLPEDDRDELAAMFDPRLEPLGLRMTRAGLYTPDDGYRASREGTHLALYAEPSDGEAWDAARYLDTIVPSAAATIPYALQRWSGLTSTDLCQEPVPPNGSSRTSTGEEAFVTQVVLSRDTSEALDWAQAELADLIAVGLGSRGTARVLVDDTTAQHDTWKVAFEEARSAALG